MTCPENSPPTSSYIALNGFFYLEKQQRQMEFFWEICGNNGDGGEGDTCLIVDADQLWTQKLSQLVCSHIQNLAFIVVALNVQWKLMYIFEYTTTKWLNSVQTQWWHCAGGYHAFGKTMQFLQNFPHDKTLKLYLS